MTSERRPAVIFDRDGTLASVALTAPTDQHSASWSNYNSSIRFDAPVPNVLALWHSIRPDYDRIIVSGRDGAFAHAMRDWFFKHGIFPTAFFHRPAGDHRVDSAVKQQILDELILPRWDVKFVIDDRPRVCEFWRSRGIPLLQVTDPIIPPPITTQETT